MENCGVFVPYALEKEVIQRYPNFILYQVYGVKGTERKPLYKTCESLGDVNYV